LDFFLASLLNSGGWEQIVLNKFHNLIVNRVVRAFAVSLKKLNDQVLDAF